ncbi:MAG: hypothetical protein R2762_10380 [Bryobacteraceae bacterium]
MGCYIASNENRVYVALEPSYCAAGTATAEQRLPVVKLGLQQVIERPLRRDKTGTRTFLGLPSILRKRAVFDLTTYMTAWDPGQSEPSYGTLFRAGLGAAGLEFPGALVTDVPDELTIQTATPHALVAGQAVRLGDELRFAAGIVDPSTFVLNAPFQEAPALGSELGRTVTYMPSNTLASATLFDYWNPAEAVQRMVAGAGVDRVSIQVNGDFHQFRFQGVGADVSDNLTFVSGMAGLTEFPEEPIGPYPEFSLVPGSLGQVWLGAVPAKFFTLLKANVTLDNDIDVRTREFGSMKPKCLVPGQRRVSVDMDLTSNTDAETNALYEAAAQRSPIGVFFQLGQQAESLCGVYMPAVVPEIPEFDDDETRLRWRFRDSRAQGIGNDEISIAFG